MATTHVREYDSTDYIACDECGTYLLAHEAIDMDGGRYHEGCAEALLLAQEEVLRRHPGRHEPLEASDGF